MYSEALRMAALVATIAATVVTMVIQIYCGMMEVEVGAGIELRDPSLLEPIPRVREKVFLLFTVLSMPKNTLKRASIRETWASQQWVVLDDVEPHYSTYKVLFVVGRNYVYNLTQEQDYPEEFVEEMRTHDDIMMVDLSEEREVLKYKVIWSMMRSLVEYDFDYFIKTDDDVFVDVPLLTHYLIPLSTTNLYTGNCLMRYGGWGGYPVWTYCSGGGYILSQDVVRGMMNINKHVRVMIRPEDGYSGYLVYLLNTHYNWTIEALCPPKDGSIRPNGTRTTHLKALKLPRTCHYDSALFWHNQDTNWMARTYRMANGLDPIEDAKVACNNTLF